MPKIPQMCEVINGLYCKTVINVITLQALYTFITAHTFFLFSLNLAINTDKRLQLHST